MGQQQPVGENREFGRYLRQIREERRLSLDAVDEMSRGLSERVTKSHLSRIENGQAIPTFPRMFTLSQIYGIPVSFMAEQFELCLKQLSFPPGIGEQPPAEVVEQAKKLRLYGRHDEALRMYEALAAPLIRSPEEVEQVLAIGYRLECVNCLVKLSRELSAKEECEKLLGSPWLTQRQRVVTFQYFAICCYRLGKFTVAMMAIEKAEEELSTLEDAADLAAHLAVLRGNLLFVTRSFSEATTAYGTALQRFRELGNAFEVCRTKLNLAASLIEVGSRTIARAHLKEALQQAEEAGYERQRAFALSHFGMLAFREKNYDLAEAHCLRSNGVARRREYSSILFRNCYYLWLIARDRRDDTTAKSNERTLRTYLSRVERYMPEAEEFTAHLSGGRGR